MHVIETTAGGKGTLVWNRDNSVLHTKALLYFNQPQTLSTAYPHTFVFVFEFTVS